MAPAGFEPAVPTSERPQTPSLDRAATGIGSETHWLNYDEYFQVHSGVPCSYHTSATDTFRCVPSWQFSFIFVVSRSCGI